MNEKYQQWLNEPSLNSEDKAALEAMDSTTIEDAFYKDVSFGTGGIRGVIGLGTNRLNIYTVRKALYGYAKFLLKTYKKAKDLGVVIAHDNRHNSTLFAKECVGVLGAFGIKTYFFDALRPTPELSFAVREQGACGGIMVTASHNPPKYNGLKFYDHTGCQLIPSLADQVIEYFHTVSNIFEIEALNFDDALEQGLLTMLGESMDETYIKKVQSIQRADSLDKTIKVVFTPLHGASREIGVKTLKQSGYDVISVKEQMVVDPDFKTVKSPNPENEAAFEKAIIVGKDENADILIATDPDGDRLGVMANHEGSYHFLTGNQTGAIMIHYLLSTMKENDTLPQKGIVYNTIVTSEFGAAIAKAFNVNVESTLTGFKFIGEKMHAIENTEETFVMGYEESYGYVLGDFVRDKDSIQALLMISEIANVCKHKGITLIDYLNSLYETYGYYQDYLKNIVLEGKQGEETIQEIMQYFRTYEPSSLLGRKLIAKEDYQQSTIQKDGQTLPLEGFPKSNVLKFIFEDDLWFVLRPSGTEPKLKIYMNVLGKTYDESKQVLSDLESHLNKLLETLKNAKDVLQ